ncbi:MAG: hypothetical protein H6970_08350 [Gammaproteobacteria bacterium]|nr:hypothetical protein [Gammaproteobacteria bacterium]MCP5425064.1 hypothetical protein [Gammaproteobacteria bacterium]
MSTTTTLQLNDLTALHVTAVALELSEYQVFLHAYRDWFGDEPREQQIDASFGSYLRKGEIPIWVRHFARCFLAAHPGYLRALDVQGRGFRQARAIVFILLAMLALSLLTLL